MTDFSPLREPLQWLEDVRKKLPKDIPLMQVNGSVVYRFRLLDVSVSPSPQG